MNTLNTSTVSVTGMTCEHCVSAVTEEISALPGVTAVEVELAPEGTSTVRITAEQEVGREALEEALDEAGDYALVG